MQKYKFNLYPKRPFYMFICFILIFAVLIFRLTQIQSDSVLSAAASQSDKKIILSTSRGYIYDRNGEPMVNNNITDKSVILSNNLTKELINDHFCTKTFSDGIFISVRRNNEDFCSPFVKNYYSISRYSDDQLCRHLIGYTDENGYGVCGIEKAFDRLLNDAKGELNINFKINAHGKALSGQEITINNVNYDSKSGVGITIDKRIQEIAEQAVNKSEIKCGAVVVIDIESGGILGCVSVPVYEINNLQKSLSDENKPFFNRAINAYPVGSVIKPFIAAAGIVNNLNPFSSYSCKGNITVQGNTFNCFNLNSHNDVDLNKAIEKSCNTYFIDLGIRCGKSNVINMLKKFGFGSPTKLCSTIISKAGMLPDEAMITSDADLANICFGQGQLTATPLQIATAYSVLARNGIYKEPYLMHSLYDENKSIYGYYKSENTYQVIDKKCSEIINTCLYNNMYNGTGSNALPDNTTCCGKTATAQTGQYDKNGNEILCTWFAGFFPYESPKYTVVVFNENGTFASEDCAPVFKEIAKKITDLNLLN